MSRCLLALALGALVLGGVVTGLARTADGQATAPQLGRILLPMLQSDGADGTSLDGFVRGVSIGLRQTVRRTISTIRMAIKAWSRYAKRAARWIALAFLVALFDRNLLAAWRTSGLRVLSTYVPLMLYVNVRLFFDRRVFWLGKVLVVASIAYGIWRHDFIPDRAPFPGYIEDVVLITLATRLLLTWSGDDVVFEHASAAVQRWGRMVALQRARR